MAVADKKAAKKLITKHAVAATNSSEALWPAVAASVTASLLEDLSSLLLPLGEYRRTRDTVPHRTKRRKVTVVKDSAAAVAEKPEHVRALEGACLVGLNACTRALEHHSRSTDPGPAAADAADEDLAVLFVCTGDAHSHLLYNHFPGLCQTLHRQGRTVRLVAMPSGTEAVLGAAIGLPRVGCIALKETDVTRTLVAKVREQVPIVVPEERGGGGYRPLQIKTVVSSRPTDRQEDTVKPHLQ